MFPICRSYDYGNLFEYAMKDRFAALFFSLSSLSVPAALCNAAEKYFTLIGLASLRMPPRRRLFRSAQQREKLIRIYCRIRMCVIIRRNLDNFWEFKMLKKSGESIISPDFGRTFP